jgi:hypothetical protein
VTNQLSYLYLTFRNFIKPLYDDFSSLEGLECLFYRYGWNIGLEDAVFEQVNQLIGLKPVLEQLFTQADALEQKIATDPDYSLSTQDIEGIAALANQIHTIVNGIKTAAIGNLTVPMNSSDFWVDVTDQLFNDLQEKFLKTYYPKAYAFLHLFGVVRYEATVPTDASRIPYTKTIVDWAQVVEVIHNPLDAFEEVYHWNDSANDFDHQGLLSALQKALRSLGLLASLRAPSQQTIAGLPSTAPLAIQPDVNALRILFMQGLAIGQDATYEVGMEVLPVIKSGDSKASGLLAKPVMQAGTGVKFPFGREFQLQLSTEVDAGDPLMLSVFPGGVSVLTNQPEITSSLTFSRPDTTTPWYLVGNAKTARIELSGIALDLSIEGTVTDPELRFFLQLGKDASTPGCKVIIPLDESDQFIKNGVRQSGIAFALGGDVLWSSKTGLRFNGETNLDITVPFSVRIGSVTLKNAHIVLNEGKKQTEPTGVELRVGTQLEGYFGPITFVVDDMGLSAQAIPYSKDDLQNLPDGADKPLFGNLDFNLGFAPPKGVGISVGASDLVGAGYLYFDSDKGEYAGVANLNFKNKINIKAFGVILTHMPDSSPGYSFLLMISEEFPPIQLGLGFSLTGLGGLIGIHRGIDVEALTRGVYNNDVGNVLFPADPLTNAYALLSSIDRLFPPIPGQYTFGLMAELAWGPKEIITIELGLILEFPEPVRIALIGVLRAVISKTLAGKDVIVLNLQVNFAGSIAFDQQFIRFDASLVQSKLLEMKLEGDMSLRVKYGSNSDFVVTLGGFHPNFQPPALDLPATLHRLQIILLSGNPSLTVSAYMAVTSNTFQFGVSGLFIFSKWGVGVRGELSFDALFQRNPFHFSTNVHFLLAASWKGYDFASIKLDGSFEGPSPWNLKASLTLSVWIFSTTLPLDKTWGDEDDSLLDTISILPLLVEDLRHISNWEHGNGSSNLCVSLRKRSPDAPDAAASLWLHPNELLTIRQSTVPLGVHIDKFSARTPQDANSFSIALQQNGVDIAADPVQDRFASAQFINMTEEQELSAPSYELFNSGLSFSGMDALAFDQYTTQSLSYKTDVIDDPAMEPQPPSNFPETGLNFIQGLLNNALANSPLGKRGRGRAPAPKLIGEKFVIVDVLTFTATSAPPVTSEAQARQMMQEMKAGDTFGRLSLAVLPASELT